jgi:glycosyltransferase involved in cell wall biosynthesis
MKIAIDIRKIGKRSTGDETYTFHLVCEMAKLPGNKKHEFFLLTDQSAAKISRILGKLPPNFRIIKVAPTAKLFWTFYSLPRFLKKNPVDLLHVQYIVPLHLSRKTKIITTIHDVSFRANPKWIGKKDSLIMNNFIPLTLKRADAVLTVSNFSKTEILKYYHYPKDKIFVTHPAIDKRLFAAKIKFGAKKAVQKAIGNKNPFILHISSLQPRKNVPLVIAAFAKLKKYWQKNNSDWGNTKLVLVGDKKGYNYDKKIDEEILKQLQDDLSTEFTPHLDAGLRAGLKKDDVIITGYLPAKLLPAVYREASVFIFPSVYEGFGIPLLEAMASKIPVIASNIGSLKEVGGEAAVFVDLKRKDNVERIAKVINDLLEDKKLREEKIKLGLERVKLFNWTEMAKKTLEVYEKISK